MNERMNIEAERARHGLTKEELCRILNVTSKTYLSYIRGGNMPIGKGIQLASLFDCSLDYIAGLTSNRTRLN